jgi:hypothetical protein
LSLSFSWLCGFSSCPGSPGDRALPDRRAPRSGRAGTTLLRTRTAGEHSRCQSSNILARSAKRPLRSWCSAGTNQLPFAPGAAPRKPNSDSRPLRPPERRPGPAAARVLLRAAVDASEEERSALYSCLNRHFIFVPPFASLLVHGLRAPGCRHLLPPVRPREGQSQQLRHEQRQFGV